jgi:hypothetical protein
MPRARERTEGSTQRRVAVRLGMFARNVIIIVKKNEVRNTGRREQEVGQRPGAASIRSAPLSMSSRGGGGGGGAADAVWRLEEARGGPATQLQFT